MFGEEGSGGLFLSTQVPERRGQRGRRTHYNLNDYFNIKKSLVWFVPALMSTRQIHATWFYDHFLNVWHLLYVGRDVVFRPFLPECEEVVEALQRVLREILHPQQADGLRAGSAVHQGDALEHLQSRRHSFSFSEVSRNELRQRAAGSVIMR